MGIYDFTVKAQDGSEVSLADYQGKVLLIVNTATGCGFTPQYDEEIHSFCTGRYGITFPQFSKIDVNGEHAIPLYQYLTANTTFGGFGAGPMSLILAPIAKKMDKDYKKNGKIKWNFTKFLISREGEIIARFEPTNSMDDVKAKIEEVL